MKRTIKNYAILFVAITIAFPLGLISQEESNKDKKVKIKTVKTIDGKKTVKDTTIVVSADDDVKKIVKEYTVDVEGDSSGMATVEVTIDVEGDADWNEEKSKKIIVRSSPHGHKKVVRYHSGDDEDDEVFIVNPHGKHKVIKWTDEEGEVHAFDYSFDFDMEDFHVNMDSLREQLRKIQYALVDEEGQLHKEFIELETLKELEKLETLERLEEIEFHGIPPRPPRIDHEYLREHRGDMEVDDIELRESGIKNKADRLEIEDVDIDNDDGVIDLSFATKAEGSTKVTVYNVYGDKVFSEKPELMNDKYQLKIDLSKKQHGQYYLMIVVGNSSTTLRLHN